MEISKHPDIDYKIWEAFRREVATFPSMQEQVAQALGRQSTQTVVQTMHESHQTGDGRHE